MGKIDELERMLEEAKREEAERNHGWIKFVIYFFILIFMIRGCSSDDKPQTEDQSTPIEQSTQNTQYPSSELEDNTVQDQTDDQVPVQVTPKHEKTPEEKLETLTGEKIDVSADSVEEIATNLNNEPSLDDL